MRVLHFSDIHVSSAFSTAPWSKWLGKRSVGAMNLLAGRARRFANNAGKLAALAEFRRIERFDLVLFTGDYTALGLDREFAAARRGVEPLMGAPLGYVGIPGNHDIYAGDVHRERTFIRHFGDTLDSDPAGFRREEGWPLVRLIGEQAAVVALDSARPNPWPWRSSGRLPARQLDALGELLADGRIRDRFVFVMNHYPPLLADGSRDRLFHRLVNDLELLEVCRGIRRGALLSGHVHHRYATPIPGTDGAMLFCSGSTTMEGREGLWCFDLAGAEGRATPGHWNGTRYVLDRGEAIAI